MHIFCAFLPKFYERKYIWLLIILLFILQTWRRYEVIHKPKITHKSKGAKIVCFDSLIILYVLNWLIYWKRHPKLKNLQTAILLWLKTTVWCSEKRSSGRTEKIEMAIFWTSKIKNKALIVCTWLSPWFFEINWSAFIKLSDLVHWKKQKSIKSSLQNR